MPGSGTRPAARRRYRSSRCRTSGSSEPVKRWHRLRSPCLSTASRPTPAPHGSDLRRPSCRSVISWCRLENPVLRPTRAAARYFSPSRSKLACTSKQLGIRQCMLHFVRGSHGRIAHFVEAQLAAQMIVDLLYVRRSSRQRDTRTDGLGAIALEQHAHLAGDHIVGAAPAHGEPVAIVNRARAHRCSRRSQSGAHRRNR